jgi:hypothetical protein
LQFAAKVLKRILVQPNNMSISISRSLNDFHMKNLWAGLITALACFAASEVQAQSRQAQANYLHVRSVYEGRFILKLIDARSDTYLGGANYRSVGEARSAGGLEFLRPFDVQALSQGFVKGRAIVPSYYRQKSGRKVRSLDYRVKPPLPGTDPIAQLLRLSLGGSSPCVGTLTFFDGKQNYRLSFVNPRPGQLPPNLRRQGLVKPQACSVTFAPISGLKGKKTSSRDVLRGDQIVTFAWSPKARLWIMTDIAVSTIIGTAHISLTQVSLSSVKGLP